MTSIPLPYAGFVPSRREPEPNDHQWLAAYERRTAGRRMARFNLNDGATAASQNAQLSWGTPLRRTRHLYGAEAESALLARARRERAEAAPVIARAEAASRTARRTAESAYGAQEVITYGAQEITRSAGGCRHCAEMGATPRESAYIHRRAR